MAGIKEVTAQLDGIVQRTSLAAQQTERLLAGAQGLSALTRQINLPAAGVSSRAGAGGRGANVKSPGEVEILNRLTAWEQKGKLDSTINFRAGGLR